MEVRISMQNPFVGKIVLLKAISSKPPRSTGNFVKNLATLQPQLVQVMQNVPKASASLMHKTLASYIETHLKDRLDVHG